MTFRRSSPTALLFACAIAVGARAAPPVGQSARFGGFLVEQVVKENPAHGEGIRLHLRWNSADRIASLDLIDDGETMRAEAGARSCRVTIQFQKYDLRRGEPRLRRRLLGMMESMADYCANIPQPERSAWRSEYQAAEHDFPAAIGAMKQRALMLFGDLERCSHPRIRNRPTPTVPTCPRTE